jgi:hypothetical protein
VSGGCKRCGTGRRRRSVVIRINDDNVSVVGEAHCRNDAALLGCAGRGNAAVGSGARPGRARLLEGALGACGLHWRNRNATVVLVIFEVEVVQHAIVAVAAASGPCASSRRRNDVHVGRRRGGCRGEARGHNGAHNFVLRVVPAHHRAGTARKRRGTGRRRGR